MKTKKVVKIISIFTIFIFCSTYFYGCSKESPFAPIQTNDGDQLDTIKRTTQEIKFLTANSTSLQKVFNKEQLITVSNGGTIEVGDGLKGICSITFLPGDVKEDVTVSLSWDSQNFATELLPHGIKFNNPVQVRFSYKNANLTGINENDLGIWYFDERENMWHLYGQTVDKGAKYVEGTTTHFSKYRVGDE